MNQSEVIDLAVKYIKNSSFLKLAAIISPRNLALDWCSIQNSTEMTDLLTRLGFSTTVSFPTWWSDLASSYRNYRVIDDLFRNTDITMYDTNTLTTRRRNLLDLGVNTTSGDDTFSADTLYIEPSLFTTYNSRMNSLMNFLHVIIYRTIRRGDSNSPDFYERELGITGITRSESPIMPVNAQNAWNEIPQAYFKRYRIDVPTTGYIDSYDFLSREVEIFIERVYQRDMTGKKTLALMNLMGFSVTTLGNVIGLENVSFEEFWSRIRKKYQGDSEIKNIFDSQLNIDPSTVPGVSNPQVDFYSSGTQAYRHMVSGNQLSSNLENLLNLIMSRELDQFLKSVMKAKPLVEGIAAIENLTSNLPGELLKVIPSPERTSR